MLILPVYFNVRLLEIAAVGERRKIDIITGRGRAAIRLNQVRKPSVSDEVAETNSRRSKREILIEA